ncbi:7383_t:CDS:2, partial [Ambispora gerdemannii]
QQQLLAEITSLESDPTKTPQQEQELETKKQKLKELEEKQKKTVAEETLFTEKKKQLQELLKKQSDSNTAKPSDKTTLYVGIVGITKNAEWVLNCGNEKSLKERYKSYLKNNEKQPKAEENRTALPFYSAQSRKNLNPSFLKDLGEKYLINIFPFKDKLKGKWQELVSNYKEKGFLEQEIESFISEISEDELKRFTTTENPREEAKKMV